MTMGGTETLVAQLDIGGDSEGAVQAVHDLGKAIEDLTGTAQQHAATAENATHVIESHGRAVEEAANHYREAVQDLIPFGSQLNRTANATREFAEGIAAGGDALLAFSAVAVAGVAAITEMGHEAGQWANQMMRLEAITGMNQEETEKWSLAMEVAGGNANSLQRISFMLQRQMKSAEEGTGAAAGAFAKLGISVTDNEGHMKAFADVFPELVQRLHGMADATERNQVVSQLLGSRVGIQLIPLLKHYDEVMRSATDAQEKFGPAIKDAEKFALEYNDATVKLEQSGRALATIFGPALVGIMQGASWAGHNVGDAFNVAGEMAYIAMAKTVGYQDETTAATVKVAAEEAALHGLRAANDLFTDSISDGDRSLTAWARQYENMIDVTTRLRKAMLDMRTEMATAKVPLTPEEAIQPSLDKAYREQSLRDEAEGLVHGGGPNALANAALKLRESGVKTDAEAAQKAVGIWKSYNDEQVRAAEAARKHAEAEAEREAKKPTVESLLRMNALEEGAKDQVKELVQNGYLREAAHLYESFGLTAEAAVSRVLSVQKELNSEHSKYLKGTPAFAGLPAFSAMWGIPDQFSVMGSQRTSFGGANQSGPVVSFNFAGAVISGADRAQFEQLVSDAVMSAYRRGGFAGILGQPE